MREFNTSEFLFRKRINLPKYYESDFEQSVNDLAFQNLDGSEVADDDEMNIIFTIVNSKIADCSKLWSSIAAIKLCKNYKIGILDEHEFDLLKMTYSKMYPFLNFKNT